MHGSKIYQPKLGQDVRRYRQERRLSQHALGQALGIPQWTVSRVEKGLTNKGKAVDKLIEMVEQKNGAPRDASDISKRIAASPELEALVIRILSEGDA